MVSGDKGKLQKNKNSMKQYYRFKTSTKKFHVNDKQKIQCGMKEKVKEGGMGLEKDTQEAFNSICNILNYMPGT